VYTSVVRVSAMVLELLDIPKTGACFQ